MVKKQLVVVVLALFTTILNAYQQVQPLKCYDRCNVVIVMTYIRNRKQKLKPHNIANNTPPQTQQSFACKHLHHIVVRLT